MKAVGNEKRCSRCEKWLPLASFTKNRSTSDGLQAQCRECLRGYYDVDAKREYNRRYVAENREKVSDYQKIYRDTHPELAESGKERSRRHYESNKEKHLEQSSRWHAENPDKVRQAQREYYHRNKEARLENARRWRENNPERVAERNNLRRALEAGAAVEEIDFRRIYRRDRDICYLCGGKVTSKKDRHLDHVIPLSRGGAHSEANLRVTHSWCNLRKGARLLEELDTAEFQEEGNQSSVWEMDPRWIGGLRNEREPGRRAIWWLGRGKKRTPRREGREQ